MTAAQAAAQGKPWAAALAVRDAIKSKTVEGAAGRWWRDCQLQVRVQLVMIELDAPRGAPLDWHRQFARQPWASYNASQQAAIAAAAMMFERSCAGAAALQ